MAKVICPGEVLIDFISLENGKKLVDVEKFQKKAGGAPANVATALVKLGGICRICRSRWKRFIWKVFN